MKIAVLSTIALLATTGAAAAYGDTEIERVQFEQQRRIEDGRFRGELTRFEYRQLLAEQDAIAFSIRQAKDDGRVSYREYLAIRAAQDEAGEHIYRQKHDTQVAFFRNWLYRHRF
jgi:hypothetical protein